MLYGHLYTALFGYIYFYQQKNRTKFLFVRNLIFCTPSLGKKVQYNNDVTKQDLQLGNWNSVWCR